MSRTAQLVPTYAVLIADDTSGALTLAETDIGTTHATVCRELANCHVPRGFILSRVYRLDDVSGLMTDVTRGVLIEVARICEAEGWEPSERILAAFDAYRVKLPSTVAPAVTNTPVHAADAARADIALVAAAHARGASILHDTAEPVTGAGEARAAA